MIILRPFRLINKDITAIASSPGKFSQRTSMGVFRFVSPIFWYRSFNVSACRRITTQQCINKPDFLMSINHNFIIISSEYVLISAVNRLKYLIAINSMISIGDLLKLPVLNVPSRDIFQVFNTLINMRVENMLALCKRMSIIIEAIQINEKYCDIYLIEHSELRNV